MTVPPERGGHRPGAIHTGINPETPAAKLPRGEWKHLLIHRRSLCHNRIRGDCRLLLFFLEDAAANDWLGYRDREHYIREGLEMDPQMVGWAVEGLRLLTGEDPVPTEKAAALGLQVLQMREEEKLSHREIGKRTGVSPSPPVQLGLFER